VSAVMSLACNLSIMNDNGQKIERLPQEEYQNYPTPKKITLQEFRTKCNLVAKFTIFEHKCAQRNIEIKTQLLMIE